MSEREHIERITYCQQPSEMKSHVSLDCSTLIMLNGVFFITYANFSLVDLVFPRRDTKIEIKDTPHEHIEFREMKLYKLFTGGFKYY